MRKQLSVALVTGALAFGASVARADTVQLTGGFISFYLGDQGGADLIGDGFEVGGLTSGCWPISVKPGQLVDFTCGAGITSWSGATVNGVRLQGDPSGPGSGRLWIRGSVGWVAKPFVAPPPSDFTGPFSAPVTLSGTVSGYYNADSKEPLFTVNVVGQGTVSGVYRLVDNGGGDIFYLDNCCAGVTISSLPQPWTYADIGTVGQKGSASYSDSGSGGVFTVRSAGADIWGTNDSFGYAYQPFDGDGWIYVNPLSLQNTNPFAKLGLMLRESLDPSSRQVIFDVRPNGQTEFMARSVPGGETSYLASAPGTSPRSLALYRNGSIVSAYVVGNGPPQKISETTVAMRRHIFVGVAVTSHDPAALTTATFQPPFVHNFAFGVPPNWNDADIGAVGRAGLTSYDANVFTVRGAGADIWGQADSFHFLNQTVYGPDFQIVARVTGVENTHPFAKAGIMMRLGRGPAPSDAFVVLDVRPTGDVEFMTRSSAGQSTTYVAGGFQQPPVWLKLALSSQKTITGSISTDGVQWTVLGSAEPDFAQMNAGDGWVSGGLVVTSHDVTKVNTSTFDNVAITRGPDPTALPVDWLNHDVGSTGRTGSATYDGGVLTVRGAGADIWGTTDAFQQVYQRFSSSPVEPDEYPVQHAQVTARVTSLTNTNPFAKAGVMIRDSEAPDSAHVLLDVRPTGDIEFMTRSSTGASTTYLGGTSLPLPVWVKLVRSNAVVSGYVSSDGVAWTLAGSTTTMLSNTTTQLGPVVTSHDPGALNTATFDHVEARVPQ